MMESYPTATMATTRLVAPRPDEAAPVYRLDGPERPVPCRTAPKAPDCVSAAPAAADDAAAVLDAADVLRAIRAYLRPRPVLLPFTLAPGDLAPLADDANEGPLALHPRDLETIVRTYQHTRPEDRAGYLLWVLTTSPRDPSEEQIAERAAALRAGWRKGRHDTALPDTRRQDATSGRQTVRKGGAA